MPELHPTTSVQGLAQESQGRLLQNLSAVLAYFKTIHPTMSLQAVEAFLLVAAKPGATVSELALITNCKLPQMSRTLAELGERNRKGGPGLGLVETLIDQRERRKKHVMLTAKGKTKVEEILNILNASAARLG